MVIGTGKGRKRRMGGKGTVKRCVRVTRYWYDRVNGHRKRVKKYPVRGKGYRNRVKKRYELFILAL